MSDRIKSYMNPAEEAGPIDEVFDTRLKSHFPIISADLNDILGFFEGTLSEEILENLLKRAGGVLRLLPPSSLRRVSHASDAVVGGPKMSYEALRGRTLAGEELSLPLKIVYLTQGLVSVSKLIVGTIMLGGYTSGRATVFAGLMTMGWIVFGISKLMISKTLSTKRLKRFLDHLILTRDTRTQHVQKVSDTMDTALRERFIQLNTLINELIDEINKMLGKGRDE